ncbi:hypothetical protein JMA_07840 [Jeotgalibacillus malaysiensis]|uniref:Uncharacterized protein n=1 Tax=Jeotgalibacillus malaysiensis TaxID=1508404 RepID=A0A0B5AJ58_9BACL|nr:hypothetical protein JMA_07840 [Jeotgalibacillus malaysiensis]
MRGVEGINRWTEGINNRIDGNIGSIRVVEAINLKLKKSFSKLKVFFQH